MTAFFRFPRTPHLVWLGKGRPRDDKVLSSPEADGFLSHDVVIEEKLDGANVGLSVDFDGTLRVQNRGSFLSWDSIHPQFKPLPRWLAEHSEVLTAGLRHGLILFGEWCYAKHSISYTKLPDWFIAFDVYDRNAGEFWSSQRRDVLARRLGLAVVPRLAAGRYDVQRIVRLLGPSHLADGQAEGLYVRWEDSQWLKRRAKVVRAEFTQAIGEHWSRAVIQPNKLIAPDLKPVVRSR